MRRIGIFGGSFAPPHIGHIRAAEAFVDQLSLDKLYVIPAGDPPHKELSGDFTARERLDMCALAFSHMERAFVNDIEIKRDGAGYTYLTLESLHREDCELYLLVGTDMLLSIDTWNHPEIIFSLCRVCYARRERDPALTAAINEKIKYLKSRYAAKVVPVELSPTEISSTEIRRSINDGVKKINGLPDTVADYLNHRERYKKNRKSILDSLNGWIGEKRFNHTLGVEACALELGRLLIPDALEELSYAALLHDSAKELPVDRQEALALRSPIDLPKSGIGTKNALHALAAPAFVIDNFPHLGSERIISAVFKHTLGATHMSVFDLIVFVADFIEQGRSYPACISARDTLRTNLEKADTSYDAERMLASCAVMIIESTEKSLKDRGIVIDEESLMAKKCLCEKYLL